jgi:hypothetical protein
VYDTNSPYNTWYNDDLESQPGFGTHSAACDYDGTPADQNEWFVSPPIAMTGYASLEIDFWVNANVTWSSPPTENYHLVVNVSTDDGATWSPVYQFPDATDVTTYTWYNHVVPWTPTK